MSNALTFAEVVEADLRGFFKSLKNGHEPTGLMFTAMGAIGDTIHRMATNTCIPGMFYISDLDPGVGKTQTIVHSVKRLSKTVGVLICVARLEEIKKLAIQINEEVGVFTSDPDTNKVGCKDPTTARVMFTTQAMVDSRLKGGKDFARLSEFHFNGGARPVRIWDESIMPGEELILTVDDLGAMPKLLRRTHGRLADKLRDMANDIAGLEDAELYHFPDIEGEYKFTSTDIKRIWVKDQRDRDLLNTLWRLSSKVVTVRNDYSGNTAVDYREHLPDDFAPILIVDASARVRETYKLWEESRENIIQLPSPKKVYDNLTIMHWARGGGKDSFHNYRNELVDGIAATINKKLDEEWLVVHHKPDHKIANLEAAIGSLVEGNRDRVKYVTWGSHQATNDFTEIKNVILAGTLFYPKSTIEARGRLSAKVPSGEPLGQERFKQTEAGEHKELILQALCRGSVRKCHGGSCAPCTAYIIAASRTGIREMLPEVFPDCTVEDWLPKERPLKGKIKVFTDYLLANQDRRLPFVEVMLAINEPNKANFNKLKKRLARWLETNGWGEGASTASNINTYFYKRPSKETVPLMGNLTSPVQP
jgi:hypothetical protein